MGEKQRTKEKNKGKREKKQRKREKNKGKKGGPDQKAVLLPACDSRWKDIAAACVPVISQPTPTPTQPNSIRPNPTNPTQAPIQPVQAHLPIHSLSPSVNHTLPTHSLTHSFTHSFTPSSHYLIHSRSQSASQSLIHSFIRSLIHSLTPSLTHSLSPLTHSPPTHSLTHRSLTHSLCLPTHPLTHSLATHSHPRSSKSVREVSIRASQRARCRGARYQASNPVIMIIIKCGSPDGQAHALCSARAM